MKFAQFQSTYKPRPIDVYERTGQELEAKYYKNREETSILRQAMANSKVEDRNLSVLARATSDVENLLETVDGKWHYASNILYKAKERLTGDKLLSASMEDYAKLQATKTDLQKRHEEGKIDDRALNAFYINNNRYNSKAVELDTEGQVLNRWNTPTPIDKIDTTEQVLKIVNQLSQHKDTLAAGTINGTPVAEILRPYPGLEGYLLRETAKGVDGEKIAKAVSDWIETTPMVKDYYDYINNAYTFDAFTLKDENGKYLTDENGDFVSKSITPADFREIGIHVDDEWNTVSNKMYLPGINGLLTTVAIQAISPNFKNTPLYKQYREQGLSDNETLQRMYSKVLTDLETDKVIDFARGFGYREQDSQLVEDKAYWYNKAKQDKKEEDANIFGIHEGTSPITGLNYDPKVNTAQIAELNKQLKAYSPDSDKYKDIQNRINNIKGVDNMLRRSFLKTPNGINIRDAIWEDFISLVDDPIKREIFKDHETEIVEYLTGLRDDVIPEVSNILNERQDKNEKLLSITNRIPGLGITSNNFSIPNIVVSAAIIGAASKLSKGNLKRTFEDAFTKAVQDGDINASFETVIFHDKQGAPSPMMKSWAEVIMNNGREWIIPSALNTQGEPMTLADWYDEAGIDKSRYTPVLEIGANKSQPGYDLIRFVPNDDNIDPLPPELASKIITPNPNNRNSILMDRVNTVLNNASESTDVAKEYAYNTLSTIVHGPYIDPILNDLAVMEAVNPNFTYADFPTQILRGVPISKSDPNKRGLFELSTGIMKNGMEGFILNQINPTTNERTKLVENFTIQDIQRYLITEYLNK
jgi:hypothetical protein